MILPGVSRTVSKSNPFAEESVSQPPKSLKAPLEIFNALKQLQESHDPLVLSFPERSQQFQSYLINIDRQSNRLAFDEMIPTDGERYLQNKEAFNVESAHEGVKIVWECTSSAQIGDFEGSRCYWASLPSEVIYHQRRNAFRAPLKQTLGIKAELSDSKKRLSLSGSLLDISATGCKLAVQGNASGQLQTGAVYDRFISNLPVGLLTTSVELRHLHYAEKRDISYLGLRFHQLSGLEQRLIDRFVYQLQREARNLD